LRRSILVAGVGNVFFGDDAFGVEVARALARERLAPAITVVDYGIRGVHLAFELLTSPPDLFVLVDATRRGGEPGTLYLVDLDGAVELDGGVADAHGMTPGAVFATVRSMGGVMPRTRLIGCEPATIDEGMELSPAVRRAIPEAVAMVRRLIAHS
jgi:hydrogenase maturation protease